MIRRLKQKAQRKNIRLVLKWLPRGLAICYSLSLFFIMEDVVSELVKSLMTVSAAVDGESGTIVVYASDLKIAEWLMRALPAVVILITLLFTARKRKRAGKLFLFYGVLLFSFFYSFGEMNQAYASFSLLIVIALLFLMYSYIYRKKDCT